LCRFILYFAVDSNQGRRRFFLKTGNGKTGNRKKRESGKNGKKNGKTGNF
jgi:hypothetical protein